MVSEYEKYDSIRETARIMNVSPEVVRKCLITKGVLSTPLSNRILELLEKGLNQQEIARVLKVSTSCVSANSPYTKGSYLGSEKSKNAEAIKKCRDRKKSCDYIDKI